MSTSIESIAKVVLSAKRRRRWPLRSRPTFERYGDVSPSDLELLERKLGVPIPIPLANWLLSVGYGDIDGELSFREEWFSIIESGQLKGSVRFAQDILGNFYAFDPPGRIYFFSRAEAVFALVSDDFLEFVEELVRRDFRLIEWTDTLKTRPYEW